MRLLQQIVARFILPTVIGSLLVAAIAVGLFFAKVPTQIDAIQSRLAANARIRFTSNAEASAALIDAVFSHFAQRASVSASLARDFLQLDGAEPSMGSAFTNTTYNSFFAAQLDGNDPSLPSDPSRYSAYYRNDILTLVDFQKTLPDPATVLDNVLRPATLNLKRIKNAQMGFADGGYRVFPLVYNLSNFNPRTQVVCNASYAPPQLAGTIGYDPRCRPFYQAAANLTAIGSTGMSKIAFTAPYLGVINGDLQVSVSVALFKSSRLFGVFSLALSLDYIASQLASTTIMSNGYIYVMDTSGKLVLYPPQRSSANIYGGATTPSIFQVEFDNNADLASRFLSLATGSADTGNTATYTKPDGSAWTFAASRVRSTAYLLIVTAPQSDLDALSQQMRSAFFALVVGAVAATLVAAAVSSYVSYRVTRGFAVKIVSPIEDMTDKLGRLGQNELALEFGERPPLSSELQQVFDNFRNLLTAVRFGNKAYYADDMQLALENYLAAEAMMIRFGNLRGEGVCANNLGGVYRMLEGEFEKALQKYQRSIEIATTLLEAESNAQTPELLKKDLAVRLNNLGVLHKDTIDKCTASPQDVGSILAESLFHRSLDLHRQTDNLEGIAQVSGNLGQLYLATDRLQEAEELLTDAFMVAREQRPSDPIALQYACLNMGLLAEARGMWEEAVTWYSYVLQRFDVVVRFVQRACLTKLIMLCLETDLKKGVNRPKLARELLERAQPLFGDLTPGAVNRATKSVMFVLDVSGSMSGSRIKTCRTSINNIIQNHCTDADSISMIKFSNIPFVLFTSLNKRQHLSNMLSQVRDGTIVSGGTAFYDAVSRAVQQITETDPRTKQKWIIALTDGEDNRSRPESARDIERMLCANRGVGVIVITVGELRNEAEIRSQVVNPAGPGKGFLFRSESSVEGISEAFGKAVRVMMGEVVMQDF